MNPTMYYFGDRSQDRFMQNKSKCESSFYNIWEKVELDIIAWIRMNRVNIELRLELYLGLYIICIVHTNMY